MLRRLCLGVLLALMASIGAEAFLQIMPASRPCRGVVTSSSRSMRLYGIFEDVNEAVKQAMKSKEKVGGALALARLWGPGSTGLVFTLAHAHPHTQERLSALRNIKSALGNALKEEGAATTLSDEQAQAILRKLQKQRQESITMFTQGDRDDMVAAEKAELVIIEGYLPSLADEAQTRAWVEAAIKTTGAAGPKDMGKVMGDMNKKHKGEVDNKLVSAVATELLKAMAG
jgi:uncharacterized protein YqeY